MDLKISSQFANDFKALNDLSLKEKVKSVLETIKQASKVEDISHFKKINGNDKAYKMGIGFYYLIAISTSETEITLMRFLHRDEVIKSLDNG